MADIKDAARRSANMAAIRSRDTGPELFVRKALFRDGFRYRLAPGDIPGRPDLFLRKYNLAVFVHGCFWHRHAGCRFAAVPATRTEFWTEKFDRNVRRDREVQEQLRAQGIRCLVIWECAIRQARRRDGDPEALIRKVEDFIRSDGAWLEVEADAAFQAGRKGPDGPGLPPG